MAPSSPPADITSHLLTLAPLALSRTQRLVSTWLPPPTAADLQPNPNTSLAKDDNWFAQSNELYVIPHHRARKALQEADRERERGRAGLGAKPTTTSEDADTESQLIDNSEERLRVLLLGKNWEKKKKNHTSVSRNHEVIPRGGSKPRPSAPQRIVDDQHDESEEEGGRSSVGRRKSGKKRAGQVERAEGFQEEADHVDELGSQAGFSEISVPPKRARSYLDEVLAENAARKDRKRRKKKKK